MDIIFESTDLKIFYIVPILPSHNLKKYSRRSIHQIDRIIFHHTAGTTRNKSIMAPIATANYHIDKKNWPGIAYHYYIPYRSPFTAEIGPTIIYQCQPLESWCFHTGPGWNEKGLGVVLQGKFRSRHNSDISKLQPSEYQKKGCEELWIYFRRLLGPDTKIFGHYHAGKDECPGDDLELWIEKKRRENIPFPP